MSTWSHYFRTPPQDANTRVRWDYTFQMTPEHPSEEEFERLKFSCDTLADTALQRLNEIEPPPVRPRDAPPSTTSEKPRSASPASTTSSASSTGVDSPKNNLPTATAAAARPDFYAAAMSAEEQSGDPFAKTKSPTAAGRRDLYALVEKHAATDPILGALWKQLTTVPDWVDWEQIRRGQDVFYRYGGPCLTGLAFQSLIGGLGATRVVETLARTGGFATPVVRHRLYETTQHVLQVTSSPESLKPGGPGFVSSVRVRLLHAAVRTRIRALAAADPSYFDIDTWGLPISDLDAAATIGTFSATIVWLALPRQGIFPTKQECADYIALWRYVGYLVGAPDGPMRDVGTARLFMECLLVREIAPSETGRALAANTLAGLAGSPPQRASKEFLYALTHWLNGRELADALGVPRPPWYYTVLVAGECLGFMALCYSHRAIPFLDRRKVAALKRVFWNVIVTGSYGLQEEAVFEFKYIPQLGKKTKQLDKSRLKSSSVLSGEGGVERRSAVILLIALFLISMALYYIWGFMRG